MTPEDFVRTFLGMQKEDNYNVETLNLLSGVVDLTKDGQVKHLFHSLATNAQWNKIHPNMVGPVM